MSAAGTGPRWQRSLGEMVLIVVSILLAFALDAWWDERELLQVERAELRAVRAEMLENISGVEEVLRSVQEHAANVDALIGALRQAGGEEVTVPNAWLGSVVSWRTSDVSTSTLDAIKASGGLPEVRDQMRELVDRIDAYQARH